MNRSVLDAIAPAPLSDQDRRRLEPQVVDLDRVAWDPARGAYIVTEDDPPLPQPPSSRLGDALATWLCALGLIALFVAAQNLWPS